jgi:hypothetical protein
MRLPCDPNVTRLLIHKVEEVLTTDTGSSLCGRLFIEPEEILREEKIYALSAEAGVNAGREELKGILARLNDFFFKTWEGASTFRGLDQRVRQFAEGIAEKSFAAYYPLNSKAAEELVEISSELARASFGSEEMPASDILKIALARLKDEFVSFSGTPLKGFQVLGLLESRSLNFDDVIVLNVNEGVLPKLNASEPLIPREVMLALGINRVEKEEEIQRYEFFRLIKGARSAHIVYSGGEKDERSRFIEELLWENEKKGPPNPSPAAYGFRAGSRRAKRSYAKLPEVASFLKNMKYTATNLDTYLECPLRFYFRHVLKIREKENYQEEPGGSEIGRFIHGFLFRRYSAFKGSKPLFDADFESGFMSSLEIEFDEAFSGRMREGARLVKEIVLYRMKRFIEKERERNPRRVAALEKTYAGTIEAGGRAYAFEARIDRIDELEDGGSLVLDYKTGGFDEMKTKPGLPEGTAFSREAVKKHLGSFQLPLYLELVKRQSKENNMDAALYDLRSAELSYFFGDEEEKVREERSVFCAKALEFILGEINDPALPVVADDSDPAKCVSCPYFYACR